MITKEESPITCSEETTNTQTTNNIHTFLTALSQTEGASDLLITVGQPPQLRIHNEIMTPAIRALIRKANTHEIYSVIQAGRKYGMCTMEHMVAELPERGLLDKSRTNQDGWRHQGKKD